MAAGVRSASGEMRWANIAGPPLPRAELGRGSTTGSLMRWTARAGSTSRAKGDHPPVGRVHRLLKSSMTASAKDALPRPDRIAALIRIRTGRG